MDKLLIIEDDNDIAELIKDYFESADYSVVIENNGQDGITTALSNSFDIILLDIMLPDINGFNICKRLREVTNIPILFVSARDADIDIIRGLGLGADDYIKKPFKPMELVARATNNLKRYRNLINTQTKDTQNLFNFADITVDLSSHKVTKNGEEIILPNKEFELLALFIKHKNKVITREFIFNSIWDESSFGDMNTVTVHIKRLRYKIENTPATPTIIETIRGAGYRLNM